MMPGKGFGVSASDVNNIADQVGGTAGTVLRMGNQLYGDQVRSSFSKYVPGFELLFKSLKHYFNVDNEVCRCDAFAALLRLRISHTAPNSFWSSMSGSRRRSYSFHFGIRTGIAGRFRGQDLGAPAAAQT